MTEEFSVSIDRYRLDEQWAEQPEMYHEYAIKAADARQEADEARNRQEVVEAELYQKIVTQPESFGLLKTTEKAIDAAITAHNKNQEAVKEVIETRHQLAIMEAAVSALEHRKKALEKLVELFIADYYATPKTPRNPKGGQERQANKLRKMLTE